MAAMLNVDTAAATVTANVSDTDTNTDADADADARVGTQENRTVSAINLRGLTKSFGPNIVALKDVDLDIRGGEFFTLLGPSGCGKTTLLRIIAGLEDATDGEVEIGGQPGDSHPCAQAQRQYRISVADIKFIVPKEGAELWVDSMAIPVNAPHPELANKFINFILQPKIGAELSNYNSYATPNEKVLPLLNKELREPPITPTKAQMKRLHYTPSIKGDQLQFVQQLWTEVQSR